MNLLKTPLWDLSDIGNLDQHQNYIRLRLFQDDFIAECSLYELLWFFGIKDTSTLHKQFKVWNKVDALEWIQEGSIYQETLPFADYWDVTRVQLTSTNHLRPDPVDGIYIFGSKKK